MVARGTIRRVADRSPSPFAFLSRRRWLKLGLGAGGLALGGAGGLLAFVRGGAPDVRGLLVLEPYEHRTLASLVDAVFPPGSLGDVDVRALDLPRLVDGYLAGEPPANVGDLRDALTYLELGPLLDGRLATFSRLDRASREACFTSWMTSDSLVRRKIALALRKLLNVLLYDHEEVWPFIHYPGPALGVR